jgi:hypothetical protein
MELLSRAAVHLSHSKGNPLQARRTGGTSPIRTGTVVLLLVLGTLAGQISWRGAQVLLLHLLVVQYQ